MDELQQPQPPIPEPKFNGGDLIYRKALTPHFLPDGRIRGYYHLISTIDYIRPVPAGWLYGCEISGHGIVWDLEDQIELYEHQPDGEQATV